MEIIITSLAEFSSKTGQAFVKCTYFDKNGIGGEIFTSKEKFDAFGFDVKKVMEKADLDKLFTEYETCKVLFDNKGRVLSLS